MIMYATDLNKLLLQKAKNDKINGNSFNSFNSVNSFNNKVSNNYNCDSKIKDDRNNFNKKSIKNIRENIVNLNMIIVENN